MAENRASRNGTGYTEGVPCWVDAQLSDVAAGKRFYGELFGWDFEDAYDSTVWARLDGDRVAALARKPDGRLPSVWTVYFATPDAWALGRRILGAGGQVVVPPVRIGADLGTAALVTDPEGAVFALWQAGGHEGFGRRHEPGTFAWVQLYARDTEGANDFYGELFQDALFGAHAKPDFGRSAVSEVFSEMMPPHFVVHFRVADCEEILGTVNRLGGRVQVPPFETSYGKVAVVTDDQGASFAVLERRTEPGKH
ncbi:VOC family protein [Streptomyces sp. NPDC098781]|uniref:VOC family protein n=1 Tax=Streptomyces sp. NPDC098781 TaxID=3366097 RepID=UPI00381699A4